MPLEPSHRETTQAVRDAFDDLLLRADCPTGLRGLLLRTVDRFWRASTPDLQRVAGVHLAGDVFRALAGRPAPAALGALTLAFDAAVYLVDHTVEDELVTAWATEPPGAPELAWTSLLAGVVPAAIAALPADPQVRERVTADVARSALVVADGQRSDLSPGPRTPADAAAVIAAKTGARRACFARLGAIVAGADAHAVEAAGRFGHALGRARQLRSDLLDLLSGPASRDLAHGTWTWPLAWARGGHEDPRAFEELVARAQASPADVPALLEALSGRQVTLRVGIEIACAQTEGRRALADLGQVERLGAWLDDAGLPLTEAPAPEAPAPRFREVDAGDVPAAIAYLDAVAGLDVVRATRREALAWLDLRPGERALEVGCGLGTQLAVLAGHVGPTGAAIGVDRSAALVAEARRRHPSLDLRCGDAARLDLPDASIDAAWADRVLHVVSTPAAVIHELARVVRPAGRLVLIEPEWRSLVLAGVPPWVATALSPRHAEPLGVALTAALHAAGFEAIEGVPRVGVFHGAAEIEAMLSASRPRGSSTAAAYAALAEHDATAVLTGWEIRARRARGPR